MKAIIFDLDGVLDNSFDFHLAKIKEFTGVSLKPEEYKDIHNGNFFKAGNNIVIKTDWVAYADFIYPEQSGHIIKKQIKECLIELSKKYTLFIISSGHTRNIRKMMENNSLNVFKDFFGLDVNKSKAENFKALFAKYDLSAKDCVFVTDTLGDVLEANSLGIKTIVVTWGYHEKERLEKGKPWKIVSKVSELVKILS